MLAAAHLARSTYYDECKRMDQSDKYAPVKVEIQKVFQEHRGRYGYRRITAELRNRGIVCNHKVVSRLMKELGLVCRVRMKKYHSYRGEAGRIAPNLLERNFVASRPNEKMVTDITEFHLFGQKLYLSVLLDLYDRKIVSYTVSDRPVLKMVTDMERVGDQAADIAEIVVQMNEKLPDQFLHICKMGTVAMKMVTDSVNAYVDMKLDLAREVIKSDDEVDELFLKVRGEILDAIREDSSRGEELLDLFMITKYYERIGDHATNIAEWVEYAITGERSAEN